MDRSGRIPPSTGDPREDARRQLRWAMGGDGLTADKLAAMPAVLTLPVVAAAIAAAPHEQRLVAACMAVADATRGLGDGVHARLLRAALAVDYAGHAKDLTSRREEFVRTHNDAVRAAGRTDYLAETPRTLLDIENRMLGAAVTLLGAPPPDTEAAPLQVPNGHGGWGYDVQDVTYRFEGRCGCEVEAVYVLRALQDGVDSCDVPYYCSRDGKGTTRFVMREGAEVAEDREVGRRSFRVATVRFAPLRKGALHRLRFDLRSSSRSPSEPWFVVNVVRPTRLLTLRLAFDRAEQPVRVWRIDGLLPEARAGDPDTAEPVAPDEFGTAEVVFENPPQGLTYGLAWSWD